MSDFVESESVCGLAAKSGSKWLMFLTGNLRVHASKLELCERRLLLLLKSFFWLSLSAVQEALPYPVSETQFAAIQAQILSRLLCASSSSKNAVVLQSLSGL